MRQNTCAGTLAENGRGDYTQEGGGDLCDTMVHANKLYQSDHVKQLSVYMRSKGDQHQDYMYIHSRTSLLCTPLGPHEVSLCKVLYTVLCSWHN